MRNIILLLLISVKCFSQTDTLKSDLIYESDVVGLRNVYFGNQNALGSFNVYCSDNFGYSGGLFNNPYQNNLYVQGFNLFSEVNIPLGGDITFTNYYNFFTNSGVKLSIGSNSEFSDTRAIKRGLKYAGHDYVTDPLSLTTKEYVDIHQLISKTKTTLPSPSPAGRMIYVNNATGGPVPAYSDGTNWRRVTDGTIIN